MGISSGDKENGNNDKENSEGDGDAEKERAVTGRILGGGWSGVGGSEQRRHERTTITTRRAVLGMQRR